jgi:AraC-like DNA-binding protein
MQGFRHHYPVWPANTAEVQLRGIGVHEKMGPGTVRRPQGIDTYLFVIFHLEASNTGSNGVQQLTPGSLMLWAPDTPHNFGNIQKRWDHSWMLVGGPLIQREVDRLEIPVHQPISIANTTELEEALRELDRESSGAHPDAIYLRNLLQNFFIDLSRTISGPRNRIAIPREYLEVRSFLEDHYAETIKLTQLAARVHRSVPRFATRFKQFFGVAPLDYLTRIRLQQARFLLLDRSYNITEAGRAVGYDNPNYFSRIFRKRFGHSPGEMRK